MRLISAAEVLGLASLGSDSAEEVVWQVSSLKFESSPEYAYALRFLSGMAGSSSSVFLRPLVCFLDGDGVAGRVGNLVFGACQIAGFERGRRVPSSPFRYGCQVRPW